MRIIATTKNTISGAGRLLLLLLSTFLYSSNAQGSGFLKDTVKVLWSEVETSDLKDFDLDKQGVNVDFLFTDPSIGTATVDLDATLTSDLSYNILQNGVVGAEGKLTISFDRPVNCLSFHLLDIDTDLLNVTDKIKLRAYINNDSIPITSEAVVTGTAVDFDAATGVLTGIAAVLNGEDDGDVFVSFTTPVSRLEIEIEDILTVLGTQEVGLGSISWCATDTDLDGIMDMADLDDDNDGIPDSLEFVSELVDVDGDDDLDGIINYLDKDIPGFLDSNGDDVDDRLDADLDGIPNHCDLDSDGDGLTDLIEMLGLDNNDDGLLDAFVDLNVNGWHDSIDIHVGGSLYVNVDIDDDGIFNHLDIDCDNDGLMDAWEVQFALVYIPPSGTDTDGDGIDNAYDPDNNGMFMRSADSDGDGILDYRDVDADNDGLTDGNEADSVQHDADGDGEVDNFEDENQNGMSDDREVENEDVPTVRDSDGDGFVDVVDVDSDNDGRVDIVELGGTDNDGDGRADNFADANENGLNDTFDPSMGGSALPAPDSDNDGVLDVADADSDNDGISDAVESRLSDNDRDGRLDNYHDTNNNGFSDHLEGIPFISDVDQDGLEDLLDIDSDNDGLNDVFEAQLEFENPVVASGTDTDGDGVDDAFDLDTSAGFLIPVDTDGDGLADYIDIDSDNDNVPDADEVFGKYATAAGASARKRSMSEATTLDVAFVKALASEVSDFDGDGIPDFRDTDDDNDGRLTLDEDYNGNGDLSDDFTQGCTTPDFLCDVFPDFDGDGVYDFDDDDADNDGITNLMESGGIDPENDHDNDNVRDYQDADAPGFIDENADGTDDRYDGDGDGAPNHLDLDSDGDGRTDAQEGVGDCDQDMVVNFLDNQEACGVNADFDGDGIPNGEDEDADNDGIKNTDESGGVNPEDDPDGDQVSAYADPDSEGFVDANTDGVDDRFDADGDGSPNHLDLDSDGDGKSDNVEGASDCDGDGIPNFLDAADDCATEDDFDGDGVPNSADDDADNDGITNMVESGGVDPENDQDADGTPDYKDGDAPGFVDTNADGVDDRFDADGDGSPNHLDLDSDGDGLTDFEEGVGDCDADGISNFLDDKENCNEEPSDFDGDGVPDVSDGDADNDGIVNVDESGGVDPENDHDGDQISDYADPDADGFVDANNDGVDDRFDADGDGSPNHLDLDSDGDGKSDAAEGVADCDNDGLQNFLDAEDDCGTADDFDGDGVPNENDDDADNDGITNKNESGGLDPENDHDGDGTPDYKDGDTAGFIDANADGVDDRFDADGDGSPNHLDLDSDNDGITDAEEGVGDCDNNGIPDFLDSAVCSEGGGDGTGGEGTGGEGTGGEGTGGEGTGGEGTGGEGTGGEGTGGEGTGGEGTGGEGTGEGGEDGEGNEPGPGTAVVEIEVNLLSPNGDNVNDVLQIDNIEHYPNNRVRIFNRWGDIVYKVEGYNNRDRAWNGQSISGISSNQLPEGTYFYVIELDPQEKPVSGFVYLKK